MNAWWESLTWLERIFAYIAFPATLLLILQTLMLLFGLGHDGDGDGPELDLDGDGVPDVGADMDADIDVDVDVDVDVDADVPGGLDLDGDGFPDLDGDGVPDGADVPDTDHGLFAGLKLFTLRGLVAFFAVAGWGGLWLLRMGLHPIPAVFLAIAMGFWAMLLMALFLRVALKLQDDGTMDFRNALGRAGTVYLTIPAARARPGKVHIVVQDQLQELDAVTDDPEPLPTGTEIVVVGLSGGNTLVVCRK
ncbi:MAG: hypothetical protein NC131_20845 [Roseburia sp.]|nr:hypothetical protein [Roseburia sp.]